jgi:hypothetical protein
MLISIFSPISQMELELFNEHLVRQVNGEGQFTEFMGVSPGTLQ